MSIYFYVLFLGVEQNDPKGSTKKFHLGYSLSKNGPWITYLFFVDECYIV